jgi:hypothetical protein
MRGNKSNASPGQIICFDTETLPTAFPDHDGAELHRLRLGVAKFLRLEKGVPTRRDILHFTDHRAWWDWLYSKLHSRIPTWVFAHNLSFDLTVSLFWEELEAGRFVLTDPDTEQGGDGVKKQGKGWGRGFMLLDDPPTVITGRVPGRGRVLFVDTMNYFLTSLAKMGESVGHPKQKMPRFDEPDAVWFPYCENDVEVTEKCVLGLVKWIRENELGRFRYTRAAQALSAYRHRFKDFPIEYHDEADVRKLERAAYYGGRLEAFYLGKVRTRPKSKRKPHGFVSFLKRDIPQGPIYELDVCSLYPHVMRENEFPVKLIDSSFERGRVGSWRKELDGSCAALVKLTTDTGYPVRDDEIGTYYPIGTYWTSLCGPELDRALRSNHVVDCAAWSRYHLANCFSGFVDFFWRRRHDYLEAGEDLYAELCKYMMNSLYGKFGQYGADWEDRHGLVPPHHWGKWIVGGIDGNPDEEYRVVGGHVQQRVPRSELFNTSPAIAGWVTACGREYMRDLMETAGPWEVLYLVTDAVYVTQLGLDRLKDANRLGHKQLGKLDLKTVGRTCEIRGLHHLTLGKSVKHGSVKPSAVLVRKNVWRETHFQHLRSIVEGRVADSDAVDPWTGELVTAGQRLPPLPGVLVYPIEKEIHLNYKRGIVHLSGRVQPLVLEQKESRHAQVKRLLSGVQIAGD